MKDLKNFIKFCLVGLSNTILSLIIYYLLNYIGINYLISTTCGYIISSISGYLLNKKWVFKQAQKEKSLYKYYALYISALIINLGLMSFQVNILEVSTSLAPYFTILVTTVYNYFFSKIWVFNNSSHFNLKKVKEEIKNNKLYYILLGILILLLAFLFINNIYNHAVADDYSNYNKLISASTSGKIDTLASFCTAVLKVASATYKGWQGTYFSNILFSINPIIISENMYKFAMFLIQIFWIVSLFILFKTIAKKDNKKDVYLLLILFTIFSIMHAYSLGEGFYWFTGTVMYLIPYSLSLLLFAAIIQYLKNNNKILIPVIVILSIMIGGTSYVTGLFVGFIYCCILLYMLVKKDKRRTLFFIFLLIFVISFAFNVLCPGNFNRVDATANVSFIRICLFAIVNAIGMIKKLIFNTAYIPFMIIAFPSIKKIVQNSKIKFEYPIILSILCLICFVCLFMPMAFSYKNTYQETRVLNIQLFYLVIMTTICFINFYGTQYNKDIKNDYNFIYILIGSITAIILIGLGPKPQGLDLVDDILYERSRKYNQCIDDMNGVLENSENKVTVKQCEIYPNTLHYYIIQDNGWINEAMEEYYKKEIEVDYGN